MKKHLVILAAVLLLLPGAVLAQSGPDNDPVGLQGLIGEPFASLNPDSINLFNGQLTVPIALGPSYPIGPSLRFQAVLTYNSRVWELGHPTQQNPDLTYTPIAGNPALGIGWGFTLGAVKLCAGTSTYCFFGPDGSQHIFDEPDAARGTNFYKSSDGSRLSLKNNGASGFEMWDEGGNHYVFGVAGHVTGYDDSLSNFRHDFGRGRDGWYLTSLSDPFGNSMSVTYYTPASINPCWTYVGTPDPSGKMQCPTTPTTSWVPHTISLPTGTITVVVGNNQITELDFPVSGGGTANWTISYGTPVPYANDSSGTINLQTITAINFPSGLGGSPTYSFSYFSSISCLSSGLLKRVSLPAGATIDYQYRQHNHYHTRLARFGPGCHYTPPPAGQAVKWSALDTCASLPEPLLPPGEGCDSVGGYLDNITTGVGRRTLTVSGASSVTDYYQYAFPYGEYGTGPSPSNCDPLGRCGAESLTIVVSPEVDLNGGAAGSGRRASRAILFTNASDGAGGTEGAPIEERVFDRDVSVQTSISQPVCGGATEQPFCPDKAIRVTQSTFEYGDDVNTTGERRLKSQVVYYQATDKTEHCTGCSSHTVAFSNSTGKSWTGNGRHYNIETHSGTLGNDSRTVTTTWAPQINSSTYLPDIFTERKEVLGSSTRDQFFEFDTANGFPKGTFIWDSGNQRVWLNCRYKDTTSGNIGAVSQEFTKTFTSSSAPAYNYCSSTYPTSPPAFVGTDQDSFGQTYTYQHGELLTARWLNGTTPLTWYQVNLTRDASTGWITASKDTAALSTSYGYDSIGRITSVTPPAETAVSVTYPSMTQTLAQRNGGTGLTTYDEFDYDTLGRLTKHRRLMPASQYVKQFFKYDGRSTPYFASEWVADSTSETVTVGLSTTCSFSGSNFSTKRPALAPGTYQLCFDPFGRPQQVIGSKFSSLLTTDRTNTAPKYYSDVKEAVTASCVGGTLSTSGTCGTGGVNATTTFVRDAFGRVTSVTEPSTDVTTYAYDVNDNLTLVTQGAQTRTFTFDPFGFLRKEITPEKVTVTYDSFGSLGNLRQATEPGSLVTLRCYDAVGRVTSVRSNENGQTPACGAPGAGQVYLGSTYNDSTTGNSLGKLTDQTGYNNGSLGTQTVAYHYDYNGIGGRVSNQKMTVSYPSSTVLNESWTYNSLGLVATRSHPRITGTFTETTTYDAALPTAISVSGDVSKTVISSVTYQPSGALASYKTGNNVTTTVTPDASQLPRPNRISTSGSTGGSFDTGTYTYDGAWNILAMGSDSFAYDNRSRLTSATLSGFSPQNFSYDRYGNLLSKGSTTFCTTTCTNNRLPSPWVYDARGNLTVNGSETLTYDAVNQQIRDQSGSIDWKYLYDGNRERIVKVPVSGSAMFTYRDEAGRVVTEYVGTTLGRDNVFLGNLLVGTYVSSTLSGTLGWQFYASDHLGSPRLVTDPNAAVVESRKYWPYGEEATGPPTSQRLRFATMERDVEANHYYDHARNYDFNLGRFLTPDPLEGFSLAPQGWNRYAYVLGNPMLLVDPLGLTYCGDGCPDPAAGHYSDSITVNSTPILADPLIIWILSNPFPIGPSRGVGGDGAAPASKPAQSATESCQQNGQLSFNIPFTHIPVTISLSATLLVNFSTTNDISFTFPPSAGVSLDITAGAPEGPNIPVQVGVGKNASVGTFLTPQGPHGFSWSIPLSPVAGSPVTISPTVGNLCGLMAGEK